MTEMINLRAALACEYAMHSLRAAHTFESVASIYGTDTTFAVSARAADGIENLRQAAELLGFTMTSIINNMEVRIPTEQQATIQAQTRVLSPHQTAAPAPRPAATIVDVLESRKPVGMVPDWQDIDDARDDYSAGLSGRLS